MNRLTPEQFARALALIKATDDHERTIHRLGDLIAATQIAAEARQRARDEVTNFTLNPDRLADAIPLARRADRDLGQFAANRYHHLLQDLISPALGGPPRRIDFHALAPAARPYLLAPFLGLVVAGVYPRLCFARSNPPHTLTYVVTSGAADPNLFRQHLGRISGWLGANYQLADHTATTVTLVKRPELPAEITMNDAWLKAGHLFLGLDVATQQPFHLPLAGMTHLLVAGTPGTGKSVFLHAFLKSCLHSIGQFEHIYAVCGQGVAFERYRGLHPKLTVDNEPEHLFALAEKLQTTMKERTARLVAERRDKMAEYILLLVDEWGAFNNPESTGKAAKEAHAAFIQNLMHLAKRGRKVGIRIALVIQEPVDRDISPGIRSALQSVVSFRLPLAVHAQALFGEITPPAVPADPRTLPIGRCIFHDGTRSTRTLLHVPLVAPPRVAP